MGLRGRLFAAVPKQRRLELRRRGGLDLIRGLARAGGGILDDPRKARLGGVNAERVFQKLSFQRCWLDGKCG